MKIYRVCPNYSGGIYLVGGNFLKNTHFTTRSNEVSVSSIVAVLILNIIKSTETVLFQIVEIQCNFKKTHRHLKLKKLKNGRKFR